MPTLADHPSTQVTKMLLIGDSGAGKTGSLTSLVKAGYNLRILDTDNGLDVLRNLLSARERERVNYRTVTDKMRKDPRSGKLIPGAATVWQRAIGLLEKWDDLGPVASWGPKDILVIDSLTSLCNAAMAFTLQAAGRLGQRPHQEDWYVAQNLIESLLQMLYDESIGCNVIIMCHITYIGEDNGPVRGYPASLGRALSPRIGRYFNSALGLRSVGIGPNAKRELHTSSLPFVELKNTAPGKVKPTYPIQTGLADYFAAVRDTVEAKAPPVVAV